VVINKIIYWTPRILSVLLALFFLSFSLEAFTPEFSWQEGSIHLLLGLLIVGITILAWKKPKAGAIILVFFGGSFLLLVRESSSSFWLIGLTPLITGILFYLSDAKKSKVKQA